MRKEWVVKITILVSIIGVIVLTLLWSSVSKFKENPDVISPKGDTNIQSWLVQDYEYENKSDEER